MRLKFALLTIPCVFIACSSSSNPTNDSSSSSDGLTVSDAALGDAALGDALAVEDSVSPDTPPSDDGSRDGAADAVPSDTAASDTTSLPNWRNWASGSRLRARLLVTPDGAEEHIGWFDTLLSQDCVFLRAEGPYRCLPKQTASVSQTQFADAACTIPLATTSDSTPPSYAQLVNTLNCEPMYQLFSVGAELGPGDPIYQQPTPDAACTEATKYSSLHYYPTGAEIPPSEFVSATVNSDVTSVGITVETLEATDGTIAPLRWLDTASGEPCKLGRASDDVWRCLPGLEASPGTHYADPSCSQKVLTSFAKPNCPQPSYGRKVDDSPCGAKSTVYSVGAQITTDVYFKYGTTCSKTSSSITTDYALGAEVPPASFVAATEVDGVTRGQLTEKLLDIGGVLQARRFWFDTQHDTACSMQRYADDGVRRCLPDVPGVSVSKNYFREMSCVLPLIQNFGTCLPQYAWEIDQGITPTQYGVVEVGAKYTGTVYGKSGNFCSPNTVSLPFAVYRPGSSVAASEFPTVTEIVE